MNGWPLYLTAFSLGLISSLHCVVMCGPLSMALPVGKLTFTKKSLAFLTYNVGRIITYTILGLVIGMAGGSARLFGWQQLLSVTTGVILLAMLLQKYLPGGFAGSKLSPVRYSFIYRLISRCSRVKGNTGFLVFGMANGMLPCGMVYFALVTGLNAGSVTASIIFMFVFGTGTLPAMLALNLGSHRVRLESRIWMKKFVPWFICLIAVLLIIRGMNLGVPFLSPYQKAVSGETIFCEP
ncbi:MAG: sulfite exporter TauE/SafE family protein [Chitinophagaceae bacterium]|nr:MAG: sulfite exporter TauE/SafE family protein [Chitinophagaceae bacterium]